MGDEIRDPARWLLGVALPVWGCGLFDCETGILWSSGARCSVCQDVVDDRRRSAQAVHHPGVPPQRTPETLPRGTCRECGCRIILANRSVEDMLCKPCRSTIAPAGTSAAEPMTCPGWNKAGCTRPALGDQGLCVRCRSQQTSPHPVENAS
jgi:hypothetical protein